MLIICFLIAAALPYLLCGVNTAIIVTKIKTGEDIRTMGSGNAGLTNTLRTQGKLAALFVLLGDVAKGVLSVILVGLAFKYIGGVDPRAAGSAYEWVLYAAGTSAILGHVFPVYYGFKGGKGVLVTCSVLLAIDWLPAVILLAVFAVVVVISKYVSLGSIIAGSLYPFTVLLFSIIEKSPCPWLNFLFSGLMAITIVLMHRENIKRLINHTEKKFGQKSK
ncbi:MAG TPA: acyl-phosphate glycerol 3-phosphate acyltransferase [Ruminococcaceae bacterium]|nr:acyl-phosphate glycerol 3-phosphate acyltransferase [Oscillospiraceae bacterium]